MNPNSFKIVFLEEQTRDIVQVVQVRGHTRTIYQNQTEYVNVTNDIIKYVDREKIVYVNGANETIPVSEENKGIPLWWWIGLGVVAIAILFWIRHLVKGGNEDEEISSY
jgi:hypothetical protein